MAVIVTAHRERGFTRAAIHSLLTQTISSERVEIALVKGYDDPELDREALSRGIRVETFDSPSIGPQVCIGLSVTKAPIVCFLDDDDVFFPNKLMRVSASFASRPLATYFHNERVVFNASGPDKDFQQGDTGDARQMNRSPATLLSAPVGASGLRKIFRYGLDANSSCIGIRRSALEPSLDVLRRIDTSLDAFLFSVAAASPGELIIDRTVLTRYRLHGDNVSFGNRGLLQIPVSAAKTYIPRLARDYRLLADSFGRENPALARYLRFGTAFSMSKAGLLSRTRYKSISREELVATLMAGGVAPNLRALASSALILAHQTFPNLSSDILSALRGGAS